MDILEELYKCDIFHLEEIGDTNPDFCKAVKLLSVAEKELKDRYHDSGELIARYLAAEKELRCIGNTAEFRKGFRAGAQMILEVMKPFGKL